MGVVTAHIVEEGNDVRVSFSGSILLDDRISTDTMSVDFISSASLGDIGVSVVTDSGWFSNDGLGFANTSSLGLPEPASLTGPLGSNSFGFVGGTLFWSASDITDGVVGAVSEITVDPSDTFFVVENTTLMDVLGASSVDGDTLWTSTTNDTIVLSTSPPVLVPEPSSAILCFFAGIGLLRRKR